MDQEQLSGDIAATEYFPADNDIGDFGDLNFEDFEENTNYNDDLSDYGEDSVKPPSSLLEGHRNGKMKNPPKRNGKINGKVSGKPLGKKTKGKKAVQDEEDELSDYGSEINGNQIGDLEDDRSAYNGYTASENPRTQNYTNRAPTVSRDSRAEEEDLSDYEEEDQEVSQYHNSLFGDLRSQVQNSVILRPSRKSNSSNNVDKGHSEDVKQSEKTNDMLIPSKHEGRYKTQKREKFNQNSTSVMEDDRPQAIGKREKMQNKKRFSKKQLELVSRQFADYYAYETNPDYKGQKLTLRKIGEMFELGHATIHKLYAEWMDDPYFYERIKRYDRYRKQTKNPERKLTLDRLEQITRLIKENPFLTQYELCVELNKIEELKVVKCGQVQNMTRTIVGKLLRMGKFRKKRVKCIPKEKNTSKSLEKRYEYCIKYSEILERRAKVYFLDESGFNLYMTRDKAWSRPNEEITVNCPISKGKRFSLIAIIGDEGLAHWRFIEGNYRKFEYLDFIRELFQKLNEQKAAEDPEQKWIVMDNCAIHDKQQTINLAREYGINILYLPSYSPQLNPIENWFHEIKCKLKKINYSGEKQLFSIMQRLLKEYEDHDFGNYYHSSLKFVEKGLKKQKF